MAVSLPVTCVGVCTSPRRLLSLCDLLSPIPEHPVPGLGIHRRGDPRVEQQPSLEELAKVLWRPRAVGVQRRERGEGASWRGGGRPGEWRPFTDGRLNWLHLRDL